MGHRGACPTAPRLLGGRSPSFICAGPPAGLKGSGDAPRNPREGGLRRLRGRARGLGSRGPAPLAAEGFSGAGDAAAHGPRGSPRARGGARHPGRPPAEVRARERGRRRRLTGRGPFPSFRFGKAEAGRPRSPPPLPASRPRAFGSASPQPSYGSCAPPPPPRGGGRARAQAWRVWWGGLRPAHARRPENGCPQRRGQSRAQALPPPRAHSRAGPGGQPRGRLGPERLSATGVPGGPAKNGEPRVADYLSLPPASSPGAGVGLSEPGKPSGGELHLVGLLGMRNAPVQTRPVSGFSRRLGAATGAGLGEGRLASRSPPGGWPPRAFLALTGFTGCSRGASDEGSGSLHRGVTRGRSV